MVALKSLAVFAIVAVAAGAIEEPRPNLTEWKAGKAAEAETAAAAAKNQSKMAAVDKVVELLKNLVTKVLAEGEEESQTYNKFACWCKDTTAAKTEAITDGTNLKASLTAEINTLASTRDTLDGTIDDCETALATTAKEMKTATSERKKTQSLYEVNAADLTGAVSALENAIASLKASKAASFVQLQGIAKTVQQALVMADALGLGDDESRRSVAALIQDGGSAAPEVEMEDYKFHSSGIIATLEKLLKDFIDKKNEVNADEVQSVHEYQMLMQEKTDYSKAKTLELEEAKDSRAKTVASIESKSQELTTVAANLLDDQEYMKQLAQNCKEKAITWDKRSGVRADELQALTQAIGIIEAKVATKTSSGTMRLAQQAVRVKLADAIVHSPSAMEAIEAEAEMSEGTVSMAFFQRLKFSMRGSKHRTPDAEGGRQAVAALLRKKSAKLKSAMLSALANEVSEIKEDVFAKIKAMIQKLIEDLLKEASSEADSKGFCDKEQSAAKQKREYAANEVAELNAEMAELEATKDSLTEAMDSLNAEKTDLEKKRADAVKLREEEKKESEYTISEAQAGLEGIKEAISLLDKWYRTNAKNTVDLSLAQTGQPDALDAGFDNGEAYTGAFGDATGILGMMDVIKSDFQRTITETQNSEAIAEQEHFEFMTQTGASLKEKETAIAQFTLQFNDASEKYTSADTSLSGQMTILGTAVEELIQLKAQCIDTGMSYDDRVSRREDEIASLKQALCILNAYKDFAQGGQPDNCGDLS